LKASAVETMRFEEEERAKTAVFMTPEDLLRTYG
jgi:hypothetical protein